LELEEQAAQSIFPHYFEKQKTDGVDHQIYVGGSLVEGDDFDPLYLKSLRLWQLMVVCGIAARTDRLGAELPLPLQATHLVLEQLQGVHGLRALRVTVALRDSLDGRPLAAAAVRAAH